MLKTKIVAVVGKKLKVKRLTKFAQYFFPQQPYHNTYTNAGERDRRTYPTHPIFIRRHSGSFRGWRYTAGIC